MDSFWMNVQRLTPDQLNGLRGLNQVQMTDTPPISHIRFAFIGEHEGTWVYLGSDHRTIMGIIVDERGALCAAMNVKDGEKWIFQKDGENLPRALRYISHTVTSALRNVRCYGT